MPRRKSQRDTFTHEFNAKLLYVRVSERDSERGGRLKKINSIKRDNMQLNLLLFPRSTHKCYYCCCWCCCCVVIQPQYVYWRVKGWKSLISSNKEFNYKLSSLGQYSTLYFFPFHIHPLRTRVLSVKMPNNIHIRFEYVAVIHICMHTWKPSKWEAKTRENPKEKKGLQTCFFPGDMIAWCVHVRERGYDSTKYECVCINFMLGIYICEHEKA